MKLKYALIPAYEPTKILIELVTKLNDNAFKVIVVNDGSGEKYQNIFIAISKIATVLEHHENKGKGHAIKTGLTYIYEHHIPDDYIIVTLDADGQHKVSDVLLLADAVSQCQGSLILGCREFGHDVPLRSRFGNEVTRLVYYFSTKQKLSDTQTGLRAFSNKLINFMLEISGDRYEYEMNVLLECAKQKIPMQEVKIETVYFDNNSGSHFETIKDSFLVYQGIINFAISSFIGFIIDYGLYSILITLTSGLNSLLVIPIVNIIARIVSSTVNFNINKNLVFKNKDSYLKTSIQYYLLVALILFGNTILLSVLVNVLFVNKYLAKIITECLFFIVSWLMQRFIIFRKKSEPKEGKYEIIK